MTATALEGPLLSKRTAPDLIHRYPLLKVRLTEPCLCLSKYEQAADMMLAWDFSHIKSMIECMKLRALLSIWKRHVVEQRIRTI